MTCQTPWWSWSTLRSWADIAAGATRYRCRRWDGRHRPGIWKCVTKDNILPRLLFNGLNVALVKTIKVSWRGWQEKWNANPPVCHSEYKDLEGTRLEEQLLVFLTQVTEAWDPVGPGLDHLHWWHDDVVKLLNGFGGCGSLVNAAGDLILQTQSSVTMISRLWL